MGSYQDLRGAMARLTSDALESAGIPLALQTFDNVQETPPADPGASYASIAISFPQAISEAIGCEGADRIVGSCNVILYTPKGQGMKPAEDIAQAVLREWARVNRAVQAVGATPNPMRLKTWSVNGPNALAPDQRPHQLTQLSCAFTGHAA